MPRPKRLGHTNATKKKISEGVSKMTDDRVNKLKEVFAIDGTVEEACYYADISKQTYYDWIKKNPKLSDELQKLRERPVLKARQRVYRGLDESYSNAMDYLKRKKKLEFGDRMDHTTDDKPIVFMPVELLGKHDTNKNSTTSGAEPDSE